MHRHVAFERNDHQNPALDGTNKILQIDKELAVQGRHGAHIIIESRVLEVSGQNLHQRNNVRDGHDSKHQVERDSLKLLATENGKADHVADYPEYNYTYREDIVQKVVSTVHFR